jgi:hypothetical protein
MLGFIFGKNNRRNHRCRNAAVKSRRAFRPTLECLEDRMLMAGNLAANLAMRLPLPIKVVDPAAVWIDQNIHDSGLHTLLRQDESDHVLSRNKMIGVFSQAWLEAFQSSTLSPTLYADLEAIVHNPGVLGMPDYVDVLANKVVNHDQANAHFQGTSLGDLQVGNSFGSQLFKLTCKWFFGADHPTVSDPHFVYQQASGTLFGSGVSYTDVRQGGMGDCWFMASLEETARVTPAIINSMFIDNGDHTYTVRFYRGTVADYVTVDSCLPAYVHSDPGYSFLDGNLVYGHSLDPLDVHGNFVGDEYFDPTNKLWVGLAEKAYAQLNESGWIGRDGSNSYGGLNGGWPEAPMSHISGVRAYTMSLSADWFGNRPSFPTFLGADFNAGYMVTFSTRKSPGLSNVVGDHVYALVGYDAATNLYTIGNPWGATDIWVQDHQGVSPTSANPFPPPGGTLTLTVDQLYSCIESLAESGRSLTLGNNSTPAVAAPTRATPAGALATPNLSAAVQPGIEQGPSRQVGQSLAAVDLVFSRFALGQNAESAAAFHRQPEETSLLNNGGFDTVRARFFTPATSSSVEAKTQSENGYSPPTVKQVIGGSAGRDGFDADELLHGTFGNAIG